MVVDEGINVCCGWISFVVVFGGCETRSWVGIGFLIGDGNEGFCCCLCQVCALRWFFLLCGWVNACRLISLIGIGFCVHLLQDECEISKLVFAWSFST